MTAQLDDALLTCRPARRAWLNSAAGLIIASGSGLYMFTMMGNIDGGMCNGERFEGLMICPYVWTLFYAVFGAAFIIGTPMALRGLLRHLRGTPILVATSRHLAVAWASPVPWASIRRIHQVRGIIWPRLAIDLATASGRDQTHTFSAGLFDMPLDELCHTLRTLQQEHA